MISEQRFRIKQNGEPYSNCLCRRPELIENYDKAIADKTQVWTCHHRLETHNSDGERRLVDLTIEELIALGMYYDRPAEELIFMTTIEHAVLHNKGERNPMYGKHWKLSEEHKRKIGKALSKKVLCIETDQVFESTRDAERKTGINNISMACHGKYKTAGGYHWKFV